MLSKDIHEETTFSFSEQAPRPPERRTAPRHLTILRVGALIGAHGRELCLIRNISAGGLMAHVYSPHKLGDKVTVELKSHQQLAGTVVWVEESNVGIQFDELVDVAEMLSCQPPLHKGWRPRLPRVEIDRLGTVRCGSRVHAVNTKDISQGGVKIEADSPLRQAEHVVVTLEKLRPIEGVVRWADGGCAGIAFNQVLPFQELMNWITATPGKGSA
jgi:hypothetical protein